MHQEKKTKLIFPIFIDSNNKVYVTDDNKKPITYTGGLETIYPITDGKEMSWRWSKINL